ncbi:cupin domain-containing protein [Streptomyces odontomachi]|uniref:cupin domain-containing protein n=1 Tax=Streptomyces odontomachi TaxID=2944940 RepID=UPI002108D55D|nr:cupin domain-containing protein [Streptomyces sp. ODS25]
MAAQTLDALVGDPNSSFRSHWRSRPGVFTVEGGMPSPFTLADLDAALAGGLLREPYVEMWRDGRRLPGKEFTSSRAVGTAAPTGFADERRIHALLDEGATMLLRCVDQWHEPTREAVRDLADELGRAVEAFFFVTPEGKAGLPLHRDDGDVFVVQVTGSKSWHVHEGPADATWHAGRVKADEPQPAELFHTVLGPGEILYVPRGCAHRATGQDGLSAHLSLAVREIGVRDLTESVQECVLQGADDAMAAGEAGPLPLSDAALAAEAKRILGTARERLLGLTEDDLVAHARRRHLTRMPVRPPGPSLGERAAARSTPAR